MAIKQVMTTTVDGVVIGLSDTIDNLIQAGEFTIANLQPYMIVGQSTVGNQSYASLEAAERNYTGSGGSTPAWFPANNTGSKGGVTVEFQAKAASSLTLPHVSYGRNILLYGTLQLANEPQQIRADNMSGLDFRVVTSIDYKKIYYDVEMAANTYSYVAPEAGSATYYQTGSQGCVRTIDNDEVTNCYVYSIFGDDDDWYCIKDWMFPADDSASYPWHMCCEQYISGNFDNTYSTLSTGYTNYTTTKTMFRWTGEQTNATYGGDSWNWNNSGNLVAINGDIVQACNYTGASAYAGNCHNIITGLDNALKQLANAGLKFKWNDTWYKPIAEGGIITGYTDDMTEESEWDDITDVIGNIVPATPGGGGGGGGDDDDPWHGIEFGGTGAGGGGAFCSVYYMTGAQLTSLKNWSNTSAPEGFDMLPSIIGLQQLPVAVTGAPTTVKFLKSGAITQQGESRVIDTQVPAGTGTGQPISFSLGSVDISRRMQQRGEPYLDYDSTIELFLPFAGTFVLDTQAVMGRTIQAEIVIDPVNGTAFAYAWVSQSGQKMPIAYGSSPIAVDLPIASNQWGISRAAFKQASHQMTMNAIKDIGNFMIGLGTFKTGQSGAIADRSGFASLSIQEGLQAKQIGSQMMTSSTINAATDTASSIVNAHQLNNTNYTAVNGSFGGSYAEWSQPFTAYVRITRPKVKKPSNFNHTQGVPCVETRKLSACTGLTICINPDCGAIPCTEAEKLMITQALVGGVYAGR